MISAAISAFQHNPHDVIIAGKRYFFSAGRVRSLNFFNAEKLYTFATSISSRLIDLYPSITFCQIIGITIIMPIKIDNTSPERSTHNTTINDATGVDLIIVKRGEIITLINENRLQAIPNITPRMHPATSPISTLIELNKIET